MIPRASFDEQSAESLGALGRVIHLRPRCKNGCGKFVTAHSLNKFCDTCENARWKAFVDDEAFENAIWGFES